MSYLIMIVVISGIILLHEFGHYAAARLSGIGIGVFSIGFGPVLFRKKTAVTEWRVSLIPLGGYVVPDAADELRYFAIHPLRRIVLSFGGPLLNFIGAFVLIFSARVIAGDSADIVLSRSMNIFLSQISGIFGGISALFSSPEALSGIVGIVHSGGSILNKGISPLLLSAALSLNLGIFNLLPLPPLDGGKIVLSFLELIDRRASRMHIPFALAGWAFMLVLVAATLFLDIKRMIA